MDQKLCVEGGIPMSDINGKECDDDTTTEVDVSDNGRAKWSNQMDFFLSLVGYCVGLGNLWRFPYFCNRNGGGAFLIPYLTCLVLIGLPLFFMEIAIGQFSGRGAVQVWSICPLFKGLGYVMSMASFICAFYFNLIIAWCLYYLVMSFYPVLPWTTCSNWWNTPACTTFDTPQDDGNVTTGNVSVVYNVSYTDAHTTYGNVSTHYTNDSLSTVSRSAAEEFWQYNALRVSAGLHDMGGIQWHLALALFAAWVLIFLCLIKGVKSVGKVVYVTAPLPYILLTLILVRAVTLPGALQGIIYYVKPDFSRLADFQVWLEAMLQMFYSLGVTWGGLHTMASYNRFSNNCYRDAVIITFLSEGTSFYAGFAIFAILGFMAENKGVHVSEVIKAGPGLGFVAYPEALAQLPLPQLWAAIFFIMLVTVGVDSEFATVETAVTAIIDTFPHQLNRRRGLVTGLICAFSFTVGLVLATQGGIYVFMLIDWYVGTFSLLLVGIMECVIVGWIYGADRFSGDIEMMLGRRPPVFMKTLWCFVSPVLMAMCFILTIVHYDSPTYGDYVYPTYGVAIGLFLGLVSIVPVPICMIQELVKEKGTLLERVRSCLRPDSTWGPISSRHRAQYTKPVEESGWRNSFRIYKW
ncbi:sodium- and chloride-dependent creatine transporter 1-like [Haliotis rufescens]|uniref:sodium- and chloride-dependent creatine transporter 1-like n=1 Tax=Haliotis rufescens TaxID=6454 RepID=UPI00201EBE4C|nr:sodium- and chloride-dependent creatine transporter 1-like [Haliotis rufescens]